MALSDIDQVPLQHGIASDNDDVVVGDEVEILLSANPDRTSALINNTGPNGMRVTTDGSDPTATHGKPVGPGGFLSLTSPYCPTDEIKAFCSHEDGTTANASEVNHG